ncbi:MAG TPA: hypothetical protein VFG80_03550 [Myxococcota bacterium]|nr:hypothetical protein [Myxococcota bacterium]
MLERELQAGIVQTAKILGYRVTAFRPAWTGKGYRTPLQGDKGWPDLALCGRGRFLVRELKVGRGTLSAEQAEWIRELEGAGVDVGVWTDSDWHAGLVEAELRRAS